MIRLNDDYLIEIDSCNYTVKRDLHRIRVKIDKVTGEESRTPDYSTVGYFGTLPGAIKGVIEDMNRTHLKNGEHDLQEALAVILENNRKFSQLMERVLEV